jgi:outer membrane protein assembly factor BamA
MYRVLTTMVSRLPFMRTCQPGSGAPELRPGALLLACTLAAALTAQAADGSAADAAAAQLTLANVAVAQPRAPGTEVLEVARPHYGPPEEVPGVPSDALLEKEHAVIGEVLIDNQNIFNLDDPKEDKKIFSLADRLHFRTRANVVRRQLLFKPGDRYSHRLMEESERLLRADSYFYDAWIRPVAYHDGKVDLKVTTKDVWTLDPGFNYGRSGGTNSTGAKLEDANFLGTGASINLGYQSTVDRSGSSIDLSDRNAFGSWTAVDLNYGNFTDGGMRGVSVTRPFYSLDTRSAVSFAALDDTQTDPLYDLGNLVDQFQDHHQLVQAYYGWSAGLQNGWVQRWTAGMTYDEHRFAPVSNSQGTTNLLPEDRRFVYPFIEWDLVQDEYLKLYNHDQIGRTEDFTLGTTASVRLGYANAGVGSSATAVLMNASANKGFRDGGSTLLLASDFSGRLEEHALRNGLLDASVRYYVEQSKNWLFYSTLSGTKGWNLDLDDQILLGGDNGLRGYPLRYQSGTERALFSVEQRYFTDWYPFRLFRVGGAIFYDMGRTWGTAPLAQPSLGLLKDAGFGLRFGNARSGLGNVIHVDLAFPLDGGTGISKVQFLVQTEATF